MLISITNADNSMASKEARKIIASKTKEGANILFLEFDANLFLRESVDELTNSNALFQRKYIVLFNNILENKEASEKFFENIELLTKSEHLFILQNNKCDLKKSEFDLLQKNAFKNTVSCPKAKNESTNAFELADAVLFLNKKDLWIIWRNLSSEFEAENLYGIINWAFKNIFLFKENSKNLKPFLQKKIEKALRINDFDKISSSYEEFLNLPQAARTTNTTLKNAMEKWILSLNIKKN